MRLFGVNPDELEQEHTSDDVKAIIDQSRLGGQLDPNEAGMLSGVFHLHEQEAREVMTPIPAVVTVDSEDSVENALRRCVSSGHTRLLVIEEDNPDRVRGIVHNNALARLFMNSGPDAPIEEVIHDAYIVPETKPLDDLLAELQRQRSYMGVVVDEYGRTVGIVTVEDILEEVVGRDRGRDRPDDHRGPPARQRRLVRARPRPARRPRRRGDRAARSTPTPTTRSAATSSASWGACPSAATRSAPTATRSASRRCARTASSPCASILPAPTTPAAEEPVA